MQELLPDLINNCFVVAPRTIARKTSAILIDLLNLTSQNTLTIQLLQQITTVFATKRFHFSASFQWFTIVVRFIVKVRIFFSILSLIFKEEREKITSF